MHVSCNLVLARQTKLKKLKKKRRHKIIKCCGRQSCYGGDKRAAANATASKLNKTKSQPTLAAKSTGKISAPEPKPAAPTVAPSLAGTPEETTLQGL